LRVILAAAGHIAAELARVDGECDGDVCDAFDDGSDCLGD